MPTHTLTLLAAIAFAAGTNAQALRVPTQYATIGAALAAAQRGDTILVAAGTYAERLTWPNVDGIRLIGEAGAANTILDGTQSGTVITFNTPLTPATVLQGFTITNGLRTGTNASGAGILIFDSSPTIEQVRVTANVCSGPGTNAGAGIAVTGINANPKILRSEIDSNELCDGTLNLGAGISVISAGAGTFLLGNRLRENRIRSTGASIGNNGRGAGIYLAGGSFRASSNAITGNASTANGTNFGGGVTIDGGIHIILSHNTIADNIVGGANGQGGGIHLSGGFILLMFGNIVATNTGEGVSRAITSPGFVSADYNNVWNNSPANYGNVTPGFGNMSVDPQFTGPGSYHLTAGSPCVDAMPVVQAISPVTTDLDGDPRRIDGNLDGITGNGARHDIGADEYSESQLSIVGAPRIGTTFSWLVTTPQLTSYLLALSFETGNTFLEPYGSLLLDSTAIIAAVGTAPGGLAIAVPNLTALRGVTMFGQALAVFPGGAGQFTNLASVTVY